MMLCVQQEFCRQYFPVSSVCHSMLGISWHLYMASPALLRSARPFAPGLVGSSGHPKCLELVSTWPLRNERQRCGKVWSAIRSLKHVSAYRLSSLLHFLLLIAANDSVLFVLLPVLIFVLHVSEFFCGSDESSH